MTIVVEHVKKWKEMPNNSISNISISNITANPQPPIRKLYDPNKQLTQSSVYLGN